MRHALRGIFSLAASLVLASSAAAESPSFDCKKAGNALERMICGDSDLSRRDALMGEYYDAAMEFLKGDDLEAAQRAQKAWLAARADSCDANDASENNSDRRRRAQTCLKAIYDARIANLDALVPDALALEGDPVIRRGKGRPVVCLRFNRAIADDPRSPLSGFFKVVPPVKLTVENQRGAICLGGFAPGTTYEATIRAGLGDAEHLLRQNQTVRFSTPDEAPALRFATSGHRLARVGAGGLPVEGLNVKNVRARLMRVSDAGALAAMRSEWEGGSDVFAGGMSDRFVSRLDEVAWSGMVELEAERNTARAVALPIGQMAESLKPGVYVAVLEGESALPPPSRAKPADAEDSGDAEEEESPPPEDEEGSDDPEPRLIGPVFYWFTVSDVGLTAYEGADGLTVAARSISGGAPIEKAKLSIRSFKGEELGTTETDAQGVGRFAPGLLRGEGRDRPFRLYAYGAAGDFAQLDLRKAPLDLSDRGDGGRPAPEALDALITTERGIYRPGETVRLTILLRDDKAMAAPDVPLVLALIRPDETESRRIALKDWKAGGAQAEFAIAPNAATGRWRVRALVGDSVVGEAKFTVEDFAPPRIEATISSPAKAAAPGGDGVLLKVKAAFLHGAAADGLKGEIVATTRAAATPFPAYKDYVFGRTDAEPFRPEQTEAVAFTLDDAGEAEVQVVLAAPDDAGVPLEARFEATIFDEGGKPAFARFALPIAAQEINIGLKPWFAGAPQEGSEIAFDVAALDAAGEPAAAKDLVWRLVMEKVDYVWHQRIGSWSMEAVRSDGPPVAEGTLDFEGTSPAVLKARLGASGVYRLDVMRKAGEKPLSSFRFESGWRGADRAASNVAPGRLGVSVEPGVWKAGDKLKLHIESPFPGPATVALADSRVLAVVNGEVGAKGGVVEVEFPKDAVAGVYALVSVLGQPDGVRRQAPSRAVGAVWLPADTGPRSLTASIDAPEVLPPGEPATAKLTVKGAEDGETTYAAVAVVDDGVLKLTGYRTPDPAAWFLGRRRVGVEMRDGYGSFIDPAGVEIGRIRSGGDATEEAKAELLSNPPRKNRPIADWVSPIFEVKGGAADVAFTTPAFSDGRVRLMALVWTAKRLGGAAQDLALVRRPLAVEAITPRFLAPGDVSQATIVLDNVDAPEGEYVASLAAEGPVSLEGQTTFAATLKPGDDASFNARLHAADDAGDAKITLSVTGPQGFRMTRETMLSSRPAATHQTRRAFVEIGPGQTLKADASLVADFLPATAYATLGVNPLPDLDLPGVIEGLARRPYGSAEQTTSALWPLLAVNDLKRVFDVAARFPKDAAAKGAARLLSMQTYAGDFGMWSSGDQADPWIAGYAMEALLSLRAQGGAVPEPALKLGLERLKAIAQSEPKTEEDLNAQAYALHLLAREGRLETPELRRFHALRFAQLTSPLAKAQIAAALAKAGDAAEARAAFKKAAEGLMPVRSGQAESPRAYRSGDYGSPIRDLAGAVALMIDSGVMDWPQIEAAARRLSDLAAERGALSTQEQAWVVRAARALLKAPGAKLNLALDDKPLTDIAPGPYFLSAQGAAPKFPVIKNMGKTSVYGVISSGGFPRFPPQAEAKGFKLQRHIYKRDGAPADLAALRPNDLVAVVLEGETTRSAPSRALVVDYLPGGLEPENAAVGGAGMGDLEWLKGLSMVAMVELRDDRFIAALDLPGEGSKFRVAYLARVVTPGVYAYGGAEISDMYEPQDFARTKPQVAHVESAAK